MAIITSGDIKNKDTITAPTWPYNCEIDLNTKSINKLSNFPTVMKGDNNSVTIVIKAPLEYQGVDLSGANCVLSYNTTWTNQEGIPSSGQIDLGEPTGYNENDEKVENVLYDAVKYLTYSWTLDVRQTAEIGDCNFNIAFLMNLERDPFIDNVNIYLSEKEDDASGFIDFESIEIVEKQLRYWSFSTGNCTIPIGDPKTTIENNYNLVLPNDIQESVEVIDKAREEIGGSIETINKMTSKIETWVRNTQGYKDDADAAKWRAIEAAGNAANSADDAADSADKAAQSATQALDYKDAIVEHLQKNVFAAGQENGWRYKKYYDSSAICYKNYSVSVVNPVQSGNGVYIYTFSEYLPTTQTIPTFLTAPGKGGIITGRVTAQTLPGDTKMYVIGAEYISTIGDEDGHQSPKFRVYAIPTDNSFIGTEDQYKSITVFVELICTWNTKEGITNEN